MTALAALFSVFTNPEPTSGQRAAAGVLWVVCAVVVLALIGLVVFGLWQLMEFAAPLVR